MENLEDGLTHCGYSILNGRVRRIESLEFRQSRCTRAISMELSLVAVRFEVCSLIYQFSMRNVSFDIFKPRNDTQKQKK